MKIQQIIENRYKGIILAKHLGGYTGTKIPDELMFLKKHIKLSKNGNLYITQYNDRWYETVFQDNYGIHNFKTFMDLLKPYFRVQKILLTK